ncbi:ABC transporter transmembrane domain-containing protein, partial [Escherichia coli]|uniref:ABC transporter transmembrane domain-containing protein n=1 Tax=Escherichia coli TaxID=562 RepID=UPI0039E17FE7
GSSAATLAVPAVLRLAIDRHFAGPYFVAAMAVALVLALATALRSYFVTLLGERVVADLRAKVYAHALQLDQAFFLEIRT